MTQAMAQNWTIDTPGLYAVLVLFMGLVVRALLSVFKAWAVLAGEHLTEADTLNPHRDKRFFKRFWLLFRGFGGGADIDDYWLGFLIGLSELAVYPVLLTLGHVTIVGAWIALKTGGQWGRWAKSRSAFNRFLVGNIATIALAYFLLRGYVAR